MALIALDRVSFGYNGHPVLSEVSLEVAAGEFLALVGPNGGGKTTLLKLILGLLMPQQGRVLVFGRPPAKARGRMGYLPQHAYLDPSFPVTVLEVVLMGRLGPRAGLGLWSRGDRQAALQALEQVQAAHLAGRGFAELSGGQRQRVLIARALAASPELLLLDEPTAGVDPRGEEDVLGLLAALQPRVTVLMVTHDLHFVSAYVNQVVCVNRRVALHPTQEVDDQLIADLYGRPMRMVRHDQHLEGGECFHG
ncbi:MAG: ABC transporter ATP-binding protein [Desulfarculus sp.]|nr:MAG: ABC transporter ATP-binding protein [Desulfarculus sp.]